MENGNKFDLIQDCIVQVNELADARGVDKCVRVIGVIQKLNALTQMLNDEDATHDAAIKELTEKLGKAGADSANSNAE